MDFKFGKKNSGEDDQAAPSEKRSQTGLLLLLLILLGGFGYLYFFTDLIRPQEQPPPSPPPQQVVKKPLPVRDSAATVASSAPDQKVEGGGQKQPVDQRKQPVSGELKGSEAAAVAPAATLPEKKVVAKGAAVPTDVARQAKVPEKISEAKPAAQVKVEPAVTSRAAKPSATAPAAGGDGVAVPSRNGPWNLVAGLYLVEEILAADIAKVKKAGLNPLLTGGPRRPVTMHRLFYKEYAEKGEGNSGLEQLRSKGGDGFLVQHGGRYELYAGSFALQTGAKEEQRRLAAAGVNVTIRQVQVSLPSRKLSAGMFTDRKLANDALAKLKNAGISNAFLE